MSPSSGPSAISGVFCRGPFTALFGRQKIACLPIRRGSVTAFTINAAITTIAPKIRAGSNSLAMDGGAGLTLAAASSKGSSKGSATTLSRSSPLSGSGGLFVRGRERIVPVTHLAVVFSRRIMPYGRLAGEVITHAKRAYLTSLASH